ncbi:helix-turn-helix domain-containing protein [Alkalicoccus halolimnae]|uniref:Helix-turn-helix domain-containing protein n=1 Tax=Alkalicoccus halolimnae TaxID=1667239 RepID=A0A5C7FH25_9BACI|nr:helix-turn-helix domain-containing protein [Alkalicoccus halolimnae]TXF85584.1 GAF domain-containing protein [Alkalicoccus halolimnae]
MDTEKKLLSLISSTRVMTSTLDLDEVLHQLIREVLNVIDGANASVLFLYDEKINKLYAKAAVGFDMTYLRHARLAPGEGMSGSTFLAKKGQIFLSQDDTFQHMNNISPETKESYTRSLGEYKLPTSALSVPLISKGDCIGVLTVDIYEKNAKFDKQNLKLLETFGAQATIAIENATLFSRNERTTKIHEKLSKAAISQGGVKEITKTLAELIEHGVVVYNEFFDLLEPSSYQTGKDAEKLLESLGDSIRDYISEDHVSSASTSIYERPLEAVHFPIKSDAYTIGYLTILLHDHETLDPLDRFAIEQASLIFALEMARQERTALNDLKHSGYVLDQLLHSEWNELSMNQIAKLPAFSSEKCQYVIVHMAIDDPMLSFHNLSAQKNQLLRLIYREVFSYRYKAFVLDQTRETTFLFAAPEDVSEKKLHEELGILFRTIQYRSRERFALSISAGLGRTVKHLRDIRTSHRDAKKCVDYIQTNPQSEKLVSFYELGIQRLFLNTEWNELEDFVSDTIGPLLQYDKAHDTMLFNTMQTYLETTYNITRTAKAMYVHPNTVKYRLQVIASLFEQPVLQGKKAFEMQLGIYIYHYLKGK